MALGPCRVVHHLPGRLRLHVPGLRHNEQFAAELAARLRQQAGVLAVQANPLTGNLLIWYRPELPPAPTELQTAMAIQAGPSRTTLNQVLLTGAALGLIAMKRLLAGPSLLSQSWFTYDLAGVATVVASIPFLRRGVERTLHCRRLNGQLVLGLVGLASALLRENLPGLTVLFLAGLTQLILARTLSVPGLPQGRLRPDGTDDHDGALVRRFDQRASRWSIYACGGALLVGLFTGDWRGALATLIAAAPTGALLTTALPLNAATTAAVRHGVLHRGPGAVAAAGQVDDVLIEAVVGDEAPILIAQRQSAGRRVAFIGHGERALGMADLGIALAPPLEHLGVDAIVESGSVAQALSFIRIGELARAKADQNRALASSLHALGLCMAATGVLQPLGASLWHNLTSLSILINSLQLLRPNSADFSLDRLPPEHNGWERGYVLEGGMTRACPRSEGESA